MTVGGDGVSEPVTPAGKAWLKYHESHDDMAGYGCDCDVLAAVSEVERQAVSAYLHSEAFEKVLAEVLMDQREQMYWLVEGPSASADINRRRWEAQAHTIAAAIRDGDGVSEPNSSILET